MRQRTVFVVALLVIGSTLGCSSDKTSHVTGRMQASGGPAPGYTRYLGGRVEVHDGPPRTDGGAGGRVLQTRTIKPGGSFSFSLRVGVYTLTMADGQCPTEVTLLAGSHVRRDVVCILR